MISVKCGITPEIIETLQPNEIFVFGSNLAGQHWAGAAADANTEFGAKWGVGRGLTGKSYAIPTKDEAVETLPLDRIARYVTEFSDFALRNPDKHFLVTKIGCGIAGYAPADIAPLFGKKLLEAENVSLPQEFIDVLNT